MHSQRTISAMMKTKLPFFAGFLALFLCSTCQPYIVTENIAKKSMLPQKTPKTVCTTSGCLSAAEYFRLSINVTADPCDDFYEYACGLWTRLNRIPDTSGSVSSFGKLAGRINSDLVEMLNDLDSASYKEKSIKLLLNVYKKCLDVDAIEEAGDVPLREHISSVFGSLPAEEGLTIISRAAQRSSESLESLVAKLWMDHGIDVLFYAYPEADYLNNSFYIFSLDQAPLGLGSKSEDYYLEKGEHYQSVRDAYLTLIENVSTVLWNLNAEGTKTNAHMIDAKRIFDFEIELARLNKRADERRDSTTMYNMMSISDLNQFGNKFQFQKFLRHFNVKDKVNVVEPVFLRKLNNLLENTPSDVVRGYILWKLIISRLSYVSKPLSDHFYTFLKIYRDISRSKDRDMYCTSYVMGGIGTDNEDLGYALGRLFIDMKNFTKDTKKQMNEMIDELYKSFKELLDSNDWMDQTTKMKAREKIDLMISNVGFPDVVVDDLDSLHKPLLEKTPGFGVVQIVPTDSFYAINNKLSAWAAQKQNRRIGTPFDRQSFAGSPAIVNAWFNPSKNSITFPAGILQPPFYDVEYPMSINFGSIGSVIGHEITHGFDDEGSQFDGYGNLMDWWTEKSRDEFEKKALCMINQYSAFCYPHLGEGVCIKGVETQGENIADNGGLKQSFYAYKNYMRNKNDLILPSFETFTQEQLFFISYANFECANFKDRALANRINTNEHAPGRDRVIGPMQNFPEFAQAFNCPLGSRMNPAQKCTIW